MANLTNGLKEIGYFKEIIDGKIQYKKFIGDSEYIIKEINGVWTKYVCDYRKMVEIDFNRNELNIFKQLGEKIHG